MERLVSRGFGLEGGHVARQCLPVLSEFQKREKISKSKERKTTKEIQVWRKGDETTAQPT